MKTAFLGIQFHKYQYDSVARPQLHHGIFNVGPKK